MTGMSRWSHHCSTLFLPSCLSFLSSFFTPSLFQFCASSCLSPQLLPSAESFCSLHLHPLSSSPSLCPTTGSCLWKFSFGRWSLGIAGVKSWWKTSGSNWWSSKLLLPESIFTTYLKRWRAIIARKPGSREQLHSPLMVSSKSTKHW